MCYWPSLDGPFVFDDIPNLELLGNGGGLTSSEKYVEFIFSAQSSMLGRPVSLLSFALNGQEWPTDPRPFRITNLLLHLVNGLLIFLLTRAIFSTSHRPETAEKNVTANYCDTLDPEGLQTLFDSLLLSPHMGKNAGLRGARFPGILADFTGSEFAFEREEDFPLEIGEINGGSGHHGGGLIGAGAGREILAADVADAEGEDAMRGHEDEFFGAREGLEDAGVFFE